MEITGTGTGDGTVEVVYFFDFYTGRERGQFGGVLVLRGEGGGGRKKGWNSPFGLLFTEVDFLIGCCCFV